MAMHCVHGRPLDSHCIECRMTVADYEELRRRSGVASVGRLEDEIAALRKELEEALARVERLTGVVKNG